MHEGGGCIKSFLLTPLRRMGLFGANHRWGWGGGEGGWGGGGGLQKGPLPKICHTNPTKMKLETVIPYLKKTQKIYEPQTQHLISADISIFFIRNQQIQI